MSNFTATIYCKECKHSKAYYHGLYSKYPTVSYFCNEHCKDVNPHDSCEKATYGEVENETD